MTPTTNIDDLGQLRNLKELWVFAYGSLMWRPDFVFTEKQQAELPGYRRDFCILSTLYRGTEEAPGLVLGLTEGGSCQGMVFKLPTPDFHTEAEKIWNREMLSKVYNPTLLELYVPALNKSVTTLVFLANPNSDRYLKLPQEQQIHHILNRRGQNGTCFEYLANTHTCLQQIGIQDQNVSHLYLLANIEQQKSMTK